MIVRNAVVRHGRRALASPVSRTILRQLSTEVIDTPAEAQPLNGPPAPPKIVSASRKKQRIVQDGILSLGSDSAHEHRVKSWTTPNKTAGSATPASPAQQFAEFQRIQNSTRSLGSRVERRYIPNELISNPPAPGDISLELLMASQTHLGHSTSLWNPANSRYIYGVRQGVHIISLETTAAHLRRAARVVEDVSYRGGLILFVGNRKGQMEIVTKAAEMAGACHLFTKWTPGGITNRDVILKMQGIKVVDHLDRELEGFEKYSGLARPLLPDLVVCLNPLENYTLLYECGLKSIPTIGVIDTNADPSWVTYTIPANDDSLRAMAVVAGVLGRAGEAGRKRRLEDAAKGSVAWSNPEDLDQHIQKETKAAIEERKAVMGRMQHNVEGFTEEEQKLLRTQFYGEELEVTEEEMVGMMGEAALGETVVTPKDEEAAIETIASISAGDSAAASIPLPVDFEDEAEPATGVKLASIEEQLDGLKVKAVAIESELKSGSEEVEVKASSEEADVKPGSEESEVKPSSEKPE
ncbi:hypothetical protein QQZ08_002026 [Neonectria magnoliae]|uniref:30S ribosomal protein S2 n=1 Tax=Neonectria magnoliae TaxID=2732573 RepID=A0ABR1ID58_9HYPO